MRPICKKGLLCKIYATKATEPVLREIASKLPPCSIAVIITETACPPAMAEN